MLRRLFCLSLKEGKKEEVESEGGFRNEEFAQYDFSTIRSATSNFSVSNRLGEGAFGTVYKGTLNSGDKIAIKRLRGDIELSTEAFTDECRVLARFQHTNLVKHLGFCSEGNGQFLVYEFLPNPSLACILCDPSKRMLVKWETWSKIILGIAEGLEYLHKSSYLHHNLTINNVLLDEEMNPKIADFSMNTFSESRPRRTSTSATAIATTAHIDNMYLSTGSYSDKSDVYSYGVIVLEILTDLNTGKSKQLKITDEHRVRARKLWDEGKISELINPALSARCSDKDVIRCIQVGTLCVQDYAGIRPTMNEVILMLTGKADIPPHLTPVIV